MFGDFGLEASHNTGQSHRVTAGLDHKLVGSERAFSSIECGEAFALFGPIDLDAADLGGVEGVHWLPQIGHEVVGQVYQAGDGAHAHVPQPQLHP